MLRVERRERSLHREAHLRVEVVQAGSRIVCLVNKTLFQTTPWR